MALNPEQIRSLAREDFVEAVYLSLGAAQEQGLLSFPTSIERRAAATLVFDQLTMHVMIKMLVGMAPSMNRSAESQERFG
jgi:hypothetical protein